MKKVLFIDTDLGGDCDDVGAVALANIFKNNGLSTSNLYLDILTCKLPL